MSVLVLAVASAAIGAAVALLLEPSQESPQTVSQVAVVATTTSESVSVPDAAPEQSQPDQASDTVDQPAAQARAQSVEENPSPVEQEDPSPEPQPTEPSQQAVEQAGQQQSSEQSEAEALDQAEAEPQLLVSIAPDLLTQGEALSITVESEEASGVAATIGARSWNLIETEPGLWWGVIAIPRDADTGSTDVVIDLYGPAGSWLRSISSQIIVLASAAPFEEVILGGTGITADPAEIQRDHDVRFVDNVSVSGPARWQGPWLVPAQGEVTGVFGSKRSYDGVPSDGWHHGHDIAADHGDPIVAPAPGTVAWTGELVIHGIGVLVDHGAGVYSGYWHMSLVAVREGMEVASGDWLGNIGTTGLSTGPHLHWEVIIQGIDVDPVQWLGENQPSLPPVALESEQSADTLN